MDEYRVNLEIYNGPLDLLLYLIRREEVEIYDIPIARITEQYVQYVELLKDLDPNLAGDFLVMAATLMEIKTRMLLPSPPPEDVDSESLEIDPRAELVRQLLEYKAFKDAAGELKSAADLQTMMYPRPRADLGADGGEVELDLEDVQVWDLLDAFDRMMAAIGAQPGGQEIIYDDTPVELHAADILDRLGRDGAMPFENIFAGRSGRGEILGLFLALLELIRRRQIQATQETNFGSIHIRLHPNPPTEEELNEEANRRFKDRQGDGPAESPADSDVVVSPQRSPLPNGDLPEPENIPPGEGDHDRGTEASRIEH